MRAGGMWGSARAESTPAKGRQRAKRPAGIRYRLPPRPHSLAKLFASRTLKAGCTVLQARRALRRIEGARLLIKMRRGNRVYCTANRQHQIFEDLKRVLLKTIGLWDAPREGLHPARDGIVIAML